MHLLGKLCGTWVVLWVLLDLCSGNPQCPCQSQPSNCPCQSQPSNCPCQSQPSNCPCQTQTPQNTSSYNPPCSNCNTSNCKNVTLQNQTLVQSSQLSPFYQVMITANTEGNGKQLDSVCDTYFLMNCGKLLQMTCYTYTDGTYSVVELLVADSGTPGMFRSQGFASDSGISSFVTNAYAFGSVSCPNCTSQPLTAIYSCPLFADCSLPLASSDVLYVISDTPTISQDCLDNAKNLLNQPCFQLGTIQYLPFTNPNCVTSYNGVPCINADKVPAANALAYPTINCCNCTCAS